MLMNQKAYSVNIENKFRQIAISNYWGTLTYDHEVKWHSSWGNKRLFDSPTITKIMACEIKIENHEDLIL